MRLQRVEGIDGVAGFTHACDASSPVAGSRRLPSSAAAAPLLAPAPPGGQLPSCYGPLCSARPSGRPVRRALGSTPNRSGGARRLRFSDHPRAQSTTEADWCAARTRSDLPTHHAGAPPLFIAPLGPRIPARTLSPLLRGRARPPGQGIDDRIRPGGGWRTCARAPRTRPPARVRAYSSRLCPQFPTPTCCVSCATKPY